LAASSAFEIAINVFASPNEAFRAVREKPRAWLPLLFVPLASAIAYGLWVYHVDIGWLAEQQLRALTFFDLTDAQIEQQVEAAANRGPMLVLVQTVISTFVGVIIVMLLQALYLRIVTMFTKDEVRYGQWLGLTAWSSLPSILVAVAVAVFVLTNDVRFVSQTEVNPLSFGNLLGIDSSEAALPMRALMSVSPVNLWSIVLLILGYRILSQRGIAFASVVMLAPVAFIAAIIVAIA
jgi:uncharacterized membrane protein YqhA